jgi:hypothetical protein
MTKFPALLAALSLPLLVSAQITPEIEWQRCLGGSGFEDIFSSAQTTDGGFIIAGTTDSNNGQVTGFQGGARDFWVVKLDASGNLQWQRTLGGSATDNIGEVQQTSDGGYIVAGSTSSNDGDVTGNNGNFDCWAVKLDAQGATEWQRTYGGSSSDVCWAVVVTLDGGYVLAGSTNSTDGDVTSNNGAADLWAVKIDPQGNILWQRTFGGNFGEIAFAADNTADGGVVLAGYAQSNNGDVTGQNGLQDFWVVKLDVDGDLEWQRCLGGSGNEIAFGVRQTSDGGYVVAGRSDSVDGDVTGAQGFSDYWVVRLDALGNLLWQKTLGGSASDVGRHVYQSPDGGLVVIGSVGSEDGDVSTPLGGGDIWMVKLNDEGDLIWQMTMGGSGGEDARSIFTTADGGYFVAGGSNSNDGDVSDNHGGADFWVVKLGVEPTSIPEASSVVNLQLQPNPTAGDGQLLFTLERAASIRVEVRDMQGKLLDVVFSGQGTPGPHLLTLPFTERPAGSYLVGLRVDGLLVMKKLVRL